MNCEKQATHIPNRHTRQSQNPTTIRGESWIFLGFRLKNTSLNKTYPLKPAIYSLRPKILCAKYMSMIVKCVLALGYYHGVGFVVWFKVDYFFYVKASVA